MSEVHPGVASLSRAMARSIIRSLADGVVPKQGAHLFTAGREEWLKSLDEDLADLADDGYQDGRLRIFNGRNGDGKTHLMHLLKERALGADFAVSYVVVSDAIPLYRGDLVYATIGRTLVTVGRPKLAGLRAILDPRSPDPAIANDFMAKAASIRSVPGINPNFATAVYRYSTEQTVNIDAAQDILLLGAWLEGYDQRLQGMAVSGKVDPANAASMLKSLMLTLRHFGFRGLAILVDEVESILELPKPQRHDSYQTVKLLVDQETMPAHTLVVASTTPTMFTDTDRGIPSSPPLWSRIRPLHVSEEFVNFNQTLVDLSRTPLSAADYLSIGRCIRSIHEKGRDWDADPRVPDDFLRATAKVAAAGRITLTFSPTRVFVKLVTETLELCFQRPSFRASVRDVDNQFGVVDERLRKQGPGQPD